MDAHKSRQYFLYAIGEIGLVVIGILIALQVSEWNQGRKERKEENQILTNLIDEYTDNRETLKEIREIFEKNKDATYQLLTLMNKSDEELSEHNLDSLIYFSVEYYQYTPSNNVVSDLLQSGRLRLIRDDAIRNNMYEWTREMGSYDDTYGEYQVFIENHILTYLIDHIALKNIDVYGSLEWTENSSFESNTHLIFKDRRYENIMDNHLYHSSNLERHFNTLERLINSIIERATKQIGNKN